MLSAGYPSPLLVIVARGRHVRVPVLGNVTVQLVGSDLGIRRLFCRCFVPLGWNSADVLEVFESNSNYVGGQWLYEELKRGVCF